MSLNSQITAGPSSGQGPALEEYLSAFTADRETSRQFEGIEGLERPPYEPGQQNPPWNDRVRPLLIPHIGLYTGYPRDGPPPIPRTPAARASLHLPLPLEEQFPSRIPTSGGRVLLRSASVRTPEALSLFNARRRTICAEVNSPPPPSTFQTASATVVTTTTPALRRRTIGAELNFPSRGQTSQTNTAASAAKDQSSDLGETSVIRRRSIWKKRQSLPAVAASSNTTAPATTLSASVPVEASISRRRSLWTKKENTATPRRRTVETELNTPSGSQAFQADTAASAVKSQSSDLGETSLLRRRSIQRKRQSLPAVLALSDTNTPATSAPGAPISAEAPISRSRSLWKRKENSPAVVATSDATTSAVPTLGTSIPVGAPISRRRSLWRKRQSLPAVAALFNSTALAVTTPGASIPTEAPIPRSRSLWSKKENPRTQRRTIETELDSPSRGQTSRINTAASSAVKTQGRSDQGGTSIFRRISTWRRKEKSSAVVAMSNATTPAKMTSGASNPAGAPISQRTSPDKKKNPEASHNLTVSALSSLIEHPLTAPLLPLLKTSIWIDEDAKYIAQTSGVTGTYAAPISDDGSSSSEEPVPPGGHATHPALWGLRGSASELKKKEQELWRRDRHAARDAARRAAQVAAEEAAQVAAEEAAQVAAEEAAQVAAEEAAQDPIEELTQRVAQATSNLSDSRELRNPYREIGPATPVVSEGGSSIAGSSIRGTPDHRNFSLPSASTRRGSQIPRWSTARAQTRKSGAKRAWPESPRSSISMVVGQGFD